MIEIIDESVQQFLDTLASKSATPGGGSVAALMGAQSVALVSMVCNLTIGKADYLAIETDMQTLLADSTRLREQLTGLIKADVDVFNKLMTCYALPKQTDVEKKERSIAIQSVLKEATEVPLACAKACRQAIELSRQAADLGYLGVISDAGAAVMAAHSGLKIAALNVYINTGSLKDKLFADEKIAELENLLENVDVVVDEVYQLVKSKL